MLIGISGKIGSGKDTVGNIIQYLVINHKEEHFDNFNDFLEYYTDGIDSYPFTIKKYADKLKDFICMLIGCTREQFEDQEFKNKELPEEWWYYKVQSQKVSNNMFFLLSYLDKPNLNNYYDATLIKTTPRLLLQIIGTECIRDKVHPNAWVNALFSDYLPAVTYQMEIVNLDASGLQREKTGKFIHSEYPNWIITDMRFPNELEAVKSRGGISIRVNRSWKLKSPVAWDVFCDANSVLDSNATYQQTEDEFVKWAKTAVNPYTLVPISQELSLFHESETALDNAEFDYTIDNNSSIEDLIHTVSLILKKEKII